VSALALTLTLAVPSQQAWLPAEFPISYWLGPPVENNNLQAWQLIRDCNFTIAGPYWGYSTDENLKMLDFCRQLGLTAIVSDPRINWRIVIEDNWQDTVRQVLADYDSHPATCGYYLQDEPNYEVFQPLGLLSQEFQRQSPAHLPYINLFPTYANVQQLGTPTYAHHLDKYLSIVKPAVLSYDHYCLLAEGRDRPDYFENLGLIREYGLRYGVPPWNIIQALQYSPAVREPSDGEMRWQVYTSLAYGMKGIMYFTYWQGIVDPDGKPTRLYPIVQQLNGEMRALGKTLLGLTSTGVFHTGEIPLGATRLGSDSVVALPQDLPLVIGFFRDEGAREYVMIANRDYSQPVTFDATFLPHVAGLSLISARDGSEEPLALTDHKASFELPPGDGRLLRLTTEFSYPKPPQPLTEINFQFDDDNDTAGWGERNSLSPPVVKGGTMTMTFTGADPYIVRSWLRLQPDQYSKLRVRMRLPACDAQGQLFWTTDESPGFADDKYLNFAVIPDGAWHEYEIPVGDHENWRGKAVRGIRLDPTTGEAQPGSKVEIDWIVGE